MKYLNIKTHHSSREAIAAIKGAVLLTVLFAGDPGLLGAIVALIGRLG